MKTLTKDSFSKLTKTEQVILAINDGKDLMTRQTNEFDIHLFVVDGLLVELWYKHGLVNIVKVEITDIEKVSRNYPELNSVVNNIGNTA